MADWCTFLAHPLQCAPCLHTDGPSLIMLSCWNMLNTVSLWTLSYFCFCNETLGILLGEPKEVKVKGFSIALCFPSELCTAESEWTDCHGVLFASYCPLSFSRAHLQFEKTSPKNSLDKVRQMVGCTKILSVCIFISMQGEILLKQNFRYPPKSKFRSSGIQEKRGFQKEWNRGSPSHALVKYLANILHWEFQTSKVMCLRPSRYAEISGIKASLNMVWLTTEQTCCKDWNGLII